MDITMNVKTMAILADIRIKIYSIWNNRHIEYYVENQT